VILTFSGSALRRFFETGDARHLSVRAVDRVGRILNLLDAAEHPEELNLPGLFLHKLRGRPEHWSVRVTGNWRITFGWADHDVVNVCLEDYH
jgi:proteic killer suppression protein